MFGGDLLAVLGAHLRGLIEAAVSGEEQEPAFQRLARRLARQDGAEHRRIFRPPVAEARSGLDRPHAAALARDSRPLWAARAAGSGELRRDLPALAETADGGSPTARFAREALLGDRLRRYWQAERAAVARRGGAGALAREAGAAGRPSQATSPGTPAAPRRAAFTETELARELEAFVGGRSVVPGAGAPLGREGEPAHETPTAWAAVPPGPGGRGSERMEAGLTAGREERARAPAPQREAGRRAPGLSGLADDMATILREQAIRHGIDLP
jgi:hypothetical protein